jgi:hypothetical protein
VRGADIEDDQFHGYEESAPSRRVCSDGNHRSCGLTVTAAAEALSVSRPALSSLLNGKADLSGEMALRIEKLSESEWTP